VNALLTGRLSGSVIKVCALKSYVNFVTHWPSDWLALYIECVSGVSNMNVAAHLEPYCSQIKPCA
jgi:hypothetical protein